MPTEKRDSAYLWDMLDAAKAVRRFTDGVDFETYMEDRKLQMAAERAVEIIGEAARHVSDALRRAHPEIPWRQIIVQRHVLAHEYGDIEQERIWAVAKVHVVDLIAKPEPLIPPLPPEVER